MRKVTVLIGAALCASACSAITDVDRFHGRAEASGHADEDLAMSFTGMFQHVGQRFEYRVVDGTNFIQSRGVVDPLAYVDPPRASCPPNADGSDNPGCDERVGGLARCLCVLKLFVPRAVPRSNAPYRLDFYADMNETQSYDGIGSVIDRDHAWRLSLDDSKLSDGVTHANGVYTIDFLHNTTFKEINESPPGPPLAGLPARLVITGLGPHRGKLVQVRVAEQAPSSHVVGLYRLSSPSQPEADLVIPGCVGKNDRYDVDLYIDANGNSLYDNPAKGAGDLGWRMRFTADGTGLTVPLDAAATATGNVDVGAPF